MLITGKHKAWFIVLTLLLAPVFPPQSVMATATSCLTSEVTSSGAKFDEKNFTLINVAVNDDGYLTLNTGDQALNPNDLSIVVPFYQDVYASFFYERAGFNSSLGWMYRDQVVNSDTFIGWNNVKTNNKGHLIFKNVADGNNGGNGILDIVQGLTEEGLAKYDDGTRTVDGTVNYFIVDGDNAVTPRDMKKKLGTFEAGTELVFFLAAADSYGAATSSDVFYTKKLWNPDAYTSCTPASVTTFNRTYKLGTATKDTDDACTMSKGLLDAAAITRLKNQFNLTLSGNSTISITKSKRFPHVIVAAPAEDPNQWILSWEDMAGGGDADYNDITFRIELKTGGEVTTNTPTHPTNSGAYYTAVTFDVYDYMPGGSCAGKTDIVYKVSIDNGTKWVTIENWDTIKNFTFSGENKVLGEEVTNWTPGTPEYTYRSARIDFAGLQLSGRDLLWKAILKSDDKACAPQIISTTLEGSIAPNDLYSRSSPIMAANVLYSGSYETAALSWSDKRPRGHVQATQLYTPGDPSKTAESELWDAGIVLASTKTNNRTIYFPKVTDSQVSGEILTLTRPDGTEVTAGDGETTSFTGTLAHAPVLAGTLTISFGGKTFIDKHTDELFSEYGKDSTINRFTGAFTIKFTDPLPQGVPVTASYTYYTTASAPLSFIAANTSNTLLGLTAEYINPTGYTYDIDNDGGYDQDDGKWLVEWVRGYFDGTSKTTEKEWKLGSVDHSTPALLTPPGTPIWYYGADITDDERERYDEFKTAHKERKSVLFIGALDGMLHAFDAGKFRWGDNPVTDSVSEQRGYFLWEDLDDNAGTPDEPNYGDGSELWAFIPANLLSKLKNNLLAGEDQAYVDASPTLADVYTNGAWRTVLLAAEGNGGDTVFCLDITDPTSPTFLWEFADPDLFRSRSSPAVGKIGRIMDNGKVRWAAFFVSGKTYDANQYPSIYVIDIADGSLIKRIYLDAEMTKDDSAPSGLGGVPSGQPAIIDSDSNGYIDRLYVGTNKGFMYKVNLSDDLKHLLHPINNCIINTDFVTDDASTIEETQHWHPIYASPAVVIDNGITSDGKIDYNIQVFFGTGDSPYYDENINTDNTTYHFFAYNDQNDKDECYGDTGSTGTADAVKLGWFYALPAGERVFVSAYAAAGKIYFGTATSETEDPCSGPNTGALYVFSTSYTTNPTDGSFTRLDTGDVTTTPLVEDEHLFIKTREGVGVIGGAYNNMGKSVGMGKSTINSWREISN